MQTLPYSPRTSPMTGQRPSIWHRVKDYIVNYQKRADARDAVASLLEHDDRMLADIGLTRHDVVAALSTAHREDASMALAQIRSERKRARRIRQFGV